MTNRNVPVTQLVLLVQRKQWKHQNHVWNVLKVNNKYTRTTSMSYLLIFLRFHDCSGVSIVDFNQVNAHLEGLQGNNSVFTTTITYFPDFSHLTTKICKDVPIQPIKFWSIEYWFNGKYFAKIKSRK